MAVTETGARRLFFRSAYSPVSEVAGSVGGDGYITRDLLPDSLGRLFDIGLVLHHPLTDRGERKLERASTVGELVFDA
jgi:hypothetical protein